MDISTIGSPDISLAHRGRGLSSLLLASPPHVSHVRRPLRIHLTEDRDLVGDGFDFNGISMVNNG
jgi:hypothetical protein